MVILQGTCHQVGLKILKVVESLCLYFSGVKIVAIGTEIFS